ncbi:GTP cyclohydrolase I family protein [Neorickettsia helminthoeca str. Oregon]|uniref:GTP cyclohydrolase I n=1 Tax=Neorickettsia helminthoeca str. Oregon TaxID=1286528 RepID=X5H4N3_9RICK|nr:GTP cyclohydrolase I [Neorickettsia helminthoeca]AHX11506.1 GTP cyclohydrolase I family protein [Neorickettsia helminthoeca str. Oregon]
MRKLSEDDIRGFIAAIGDDPDRRELKDTPRLLLEILTKCFAGYAHNSLDSLITPMESCCTESLVVLKDIPFFSFCEHHILPISGNISVGYVPDAFITSIGSIKRLVHACTRRLQMQERICTQIATALDRVLSPKGVIVYATARHMCMMHNDGIFDASAKTGVFLDNQRTEIQEFFCVIKK